MFETFLHKDTTMTGQKIKKKNGSAASTLISALVIIIIIRHCSAKAKIDKYMFVFFFFL